MTVRLYKSTDTSAPTLNGTVGALITVLDAILVNGYGSQSAAGWTKPYSGTNTAVYRMATSGNSGFYLDVNDNGPGTGAAREARMRGYETMSAVGTGTNAFPTAAQLTNGLSIRKSSTADSTARAWYCLANGSVFYLFVESNDFTSPNACPGFMFGDILSYKSADPYNCAIIGTATEQSSTPGTNATLFAALVITTTGSPAIHNGNLTSHYIARSSSAVAGSLAFGKHVDCGKAMNASMGVGTAGSDMMAYPNAADNGLILCPVFVHHGGTLRGQLKGVWAPAHALPVGTGDIINGTGNLAGKSFFGVILPAGGSGAQRGCVLLETSDTWS